MTYSLKRAALVCAALALLIASPAQAAFHLYRIAEVFSSADGSVQFIRLHESFGANNQNFVSGQTIVCTSGPTTHTFTFPSNLASTATANTDILIATSNFGALPGGVTPDYVIPAGFIIIGGGQLNFAGVSVVAYGALPTNGQQSINAAGVIGTNTPGNFAGSHGSVNVPAGVCCINAACDFVTQVACTGTWTSGGTCAADPCSPPPPPGLCCAGSTCRVDMAANCTGTNTLFVSSPACNEPGNNSGPCCRADFNHVGGLGVQDIFDFLASWFSGSLEADFVGNGTTTPNVQSIFDFLGAWFTGC